MAPKISDEQKEKQREKIRIGAKAVFRRKGYEQTTMKDIREEAKISTGSLYMYFATKEEVFLNILEVDMLGADERMTIDSNSSVWSQINLFIDNYKKHYEYICDEIIPIAYEYLMSAWREPSRSEIAMKRYKSATDYFNLLIKEGIDRGEFKPVIDPSEISKFIVTISEGLNSISLSLGRESVDIDEQLNTLKVFLEFSLGIKK
ncbi:MAG: TetR family transcriptional regulator [Clostridium sp.]